MSSSTGSSSGFIAGTDKAHAVSSSLGDWSDLLRGIRHALHSRFIFIASYDTASNACSIDHSDKISEDFRRSFASHPSIGDLWPRAILDSIAPGKVWTCDDIFARGKRGSSRFYTTWLLPQGAAFLMCGIVGRQSTTVSHIVVGRGENQGPYQPEEVRIYSEMLSQVNHMTEWQSVMGQLQNMSKVNLEVLDLLPIGIIVLDGRDRPILVNRCAKDILGRSGVQNGTTTLPKHGENGFRRRRPAVDLSRRNSAGAGPSAEGRLMLLDRPRGERPLSGVLYPLSVDENDGNKDSPAAVMFLSDPNHSVKIDRERLQGLYGLTPAEARVAALLAEGTHLEEGAKVLGVSLSTARTHLQRIFGKTGTQTQADLVRLVLDLSVRVGR